MKKIALGLSLFLVLAVLLLAGLDRYGFRLGGLGLDWNEEAGALRDLAEQFLEDLTYKDFAAAAEYHTWADQEEVDIPRLIERMFKIKPELLNIRDIRITEVDLDSGGERARTFFTVTMEILNSAGDQPDEPNRERQVEGILYWHKRPAAEGVAAPEEGASVDLPSGERWFMMLESSLHG